MDKKIAFGIVGGALDALIGDVHIKGATFDKEAELRAGCFSRNFDKTLAAGKHYGLDEERSYHTFEEMAKKESGREDGIDYVIIATHRIIRIILPQKCFLEHGIHVMCDKPMTLESAQGQELKKIADEKGLLFGVTYTYTGYPMVKQAKLMIEKGEIGELRSVKRTLFAGLGWHLIWRKLEQNKRHGAVIRSKQGLLIVWEILVRTLKIC